MQVATYLHRRSYHNKRDRIEVYSTRAPQYVLEFAASPRFTVFAAGQNLANRRFSQSIQVDNAAGKSFEPADPRSFYAGMRWTP
jgi:TonB dependent receptor.